MAILLTDDLKALIVGGTIVVTAFSFLVCSLVPFYLLTRMLGVFFRKRWHNLYCHKRNKV